MDTPTPAAGAAPAIDTTVPAAPAVTPAPATPPTPVEAAKPSESATAASVHELASTLTSAERRAIAIGQKTIQDVAAARGLQAKPAEPAAAAAPAAPAAEPPAAAAPASEPNPQPGEAPAPAAAGEEEDGETDELKRMRITPRDYMEREVIRLMKPTRGPDGAVLEPGLSMRDAYLKVYGAPPAAAGAPVAAPAAPQSVEDPSVKEFDGRISALNAQIEKLSADRAKAREDVDYGTADSLSDAIAEARADLKLLNRDRDEYVRTRDARAAQTIEQRTTASRDRLFEVYPDLKAEGSMPRLALDAFVNQALADPARAREFTDPNWPEKIGAEFASKFGLKKPGSAATPPAAPSTIPATTSAKPQPQTPAPGTRAKPQQVPGAKGLTSADGAQPSGAKVSAADVSANLASMSPAQRRRLVTMKR